MRTVTLLVIGVCLMAPARAAELDPATAQAIKAAEATMLAGAESGLVVPSLKMLTPDAAAALVKAADGQPRLAIPLPPGTPAESLRILAGRTGNIEFTGPVTITREFAEAFAGFEKVLSFSGPVAPIDPEVARRLTFPGMLSISGPIALSDEVAGILGERRGDLYITGLTAITPAVARMLVGRKESIVFREPVELDAECAAILATCRGPRLELGGVTALSPEAARALARFPGALGLGGLKELSPDVAAILAENPSWLTVGVETLSPEVATVLARHRGDLGLSRITSLTPAAARALAAAPGEIGLYRLATLDAETAAALATHRGDLDICNLKSLPLDAARALMGLEGNLNLDELPVVDAALAEVFASRQGGLLLLRYVDALSPEVAEILAPNPNIRYQYWKLRTLTPEAAAGLAAWPEDLALFVDSISAEAAAALAPHERELSLRSIESLDGPDAVEVARALAMKKGSIALRSLKRITPRALMALAEKAEVEIPAFETLKIVPDDPGGLVEDVVLPDAFLEWQRRR